MSKHVVVIGGGVAGLEAAGRLSREGMDVSLLEREGHTGGHLNRWFKLFPDRRDSTEVKDYLDGLTHVNNIRLFTNVTIEKLRKEKDHFTVIDK